MIVFWDVLVYILVDHPENEGNRFSKMLVPIFWDVMAMWYGR
jgi:hypothetical protein